MTKKSIFGIAGTLVLVFLLTAFIGPVMTKSIMGEEKRLNFVEDLPPNHEIPWKQALVEQVKVAPQEVQQKLVEENNLRLTASMVTFLWEKESYRCPISDFSYAFGSGTVQTTLGYPPRLADADLTDELYSVISTEDECALVAVTSCYNIAHQIVTSTTTTLGQAQLQFEIEEGKDLYDYVDNETATRLGSIFKLPNDNGHVVTSPGDIFDLGQMTYNGMSAQV